MKKTVKRAVALALSATLVFSLATGCQNKKKAKYNIGICQLVQHDALNAATEGFKKALEDKLGDDVSFDVQNAQGDS
ncbi:MAG TPA: ABC transporter substrate-binding protein, partial [Eubacterium sp.]|nr:ABC transporter substrate-binding protein [Eubacterium sp.]